MKQCQLTRVMGRLLGASGKGFWEGFFTLERKCEEGLCSFLFTWLVLAVMLGSLAAFLLHRVEKPKHHSLSSRIAEQEDKEPGRWGRT